MKKTWIAALLLMFLVPLVAQAQSSVSTLYDDVLTLPGCGSTGSQSCAQVDGTDSVVLQKPVRIERFVPGSGYVGVFFRDLSGSFGANGGFNLDQVFFEPNSGGRSQIGVAEQVFERGNLVIEFDQPYTADRRLETRYELVVYYLAHTDRQRDQFLFELQDDPAEFQRFKDRSKNEITELCNALLGNERLPEACPRSTATPIEQDNVTGDEFRTDPNALPELDFSGQPSRAPEVTLRTDYRQTFIGEPVTLEIQEVYDPDGKCQFFEYRWEKPSVMQVSQGSVDPRMGDFFFIPQNSGAFSLRLRVREACKELGTLSSQPVQVRVLVNDKANVFPDLNEAPQYQNALLDLYHLGVLSGYPDGTIRPNQPVNRAEFLKMVFETLQYRIDQTTFSARYPDVLPTDWFAPYVHQADVLGVIKGYPDGRFYPGQTVNLVEALKMAMMFTTLEIMDGTVYRFADVSNTDWFSRYVQTAFREGILDDIQPGGRVFPSQAITRGKAALIIVRTLLFPVNRINETDRNVLRRPEEFQDFSSFDY